jgi:nucleotide-binding universal stress UspA family protein
MRIPPEPTVVVGVDGSDPCLDALSFAVPEAAARRWPLTLLHAGGTPGDEALTVAHARVRELDGSVAVVTTASDSRPAQALVDAAGPEGLVVVGARGRGAIGTRLLGSTSATLARRATCPVVVVGRHLGEPGGRVVLGVARVTTADVVGQAFAVASARSLELLAVHSWEGGTDLTDTFLRAGADVRQERVAAEEQVLAEALAPWLDKFPEVAVRRYVSDQPPERVLLAHAIGALLVVVGRGAPQRSALVGVGSTTRALLHRGACPVMVVNVP